MRPAYALAYRALLFIKKTRKRRLASIEPNFVFLVVTAASVAFLIIRFFTDVLTHDFPARAGAR